ncbi:DUF4253 domain-containing protein [Gorillibacterium sp. sgz5001074]|uniref:DUF4253 domain-containing protein n=1 Tax=Gorillibacterium sp. sgz5001074 TaxID=3446695 RepID=UPI003F6757BD
MDIRQGTTANTEFHLKLGVKVPVQKERELFSSVVAAGRQDLLKLLLEGLMVQAALQEGLAEPWKHSGGANEPIPDATKGSLKRPGKGQAAVYEVVCYGGLWCSNLIPGLREWLKPLGFQVYMRDGKTNSGEVICFFHGTEPGDILWYYETASPYYELTPADISQQTERWSQRYGTEIAGAGKNWIHLFFPELPSERDTFRREATEFCPELALVPDWERAWIHNPERKGCYLLLHWR